jgi:Ras-related protein Rab-2A
MAQVIMDSSEYLFRVLIVGDTGVGKSCFLLRFTENRFKDQHNVTIGVEFGAKTLSIEGHLVKLQIWDTAGQESFRSITRSFYRKADGVLLMYDVTDALSFANCTSWVQEIQENVPEQGNVLYLVGNQVDAEDRQVTLEEAQALVQSCGLSGCKETSAKTGYNVDTVFQEFGKIMLDRLISHRGSVKSEQSTLSLQPNTTKKNKKCC